MKYCIGCVHLNFEPGSEGWSTDVTFGIDAHDAEFACKRGHWRRDISGASDLPDIEKLMQKAETCPDFNERAVSAGAEPT